MLIQCLWRLEIGRRDGARELLNIGKAQQANAKSAAKSENGVKPNGKVEDQTKKILGAMFSLRKLKYLACRKRFKETMKPYDVRDVVEAFGGGQMKLATSVKQLKKEMDRVDKLVASLTKRVDNRRQTSATSGSNR